MSSRYFSGWIFLMLLLIPQGGKAQNRDLAIETIQVLKSGMLWVVIPTQHRKIEVLQQQVSGQPSDKRSEQLLRKTTAHRDSLNQYLREAINTSYHFSSFEFIDDTALVMMLDSLRRTGSTNHFFLDHTTTENGGGALVISDLSRKALGKPLPYFVRTTKISALLDAIFGAKDDVWRYLPSAVTKLNDRLENFYQKYYR